MATVTNLNPQGSGSYRDAILNGSGNIDFNGASGDIVLYEPLEVTRDTFTIDGTTAGPGGITIWGHQHLFTSGGDNVTMKHVRLVTGDFNARSENGKRGWGRQNVIGDAQNGIEASGVTGLVLENLSVYGSMDELLDLYNTDATVRLCLFARALNDSYHANGEHAYGGLISVTTTNRTVKLYNNAWAHTTARNIGIGLNATGTLTLHMYGNLFYNSATHAFHATSNDILNATIDAVSNCWRQGPNTNWGIFAWNDIKDIDIYQTGNTIERLDGTSVDPWTTESQLSGQLATTQSDGTPDAVLSRSALLAAVGASDSRWSWDDEIIDEINNRRGTIIDGLAQSYKGHVPAALYAATPDVTTGLIHRFELESSGADSVGSASFTVPGTASYSAGIIGNGVNLVAGTALNAGNQTTANFGASTSFCVCGWFKIDALPGGLSDIFIKKQSPGNVAGWVVYTNASGDLAFQVSDGTDTVTVSTSAVIQADTWYHFAGVLDRSTGRLTLYQDGEIVADSEAAGIENVGDLTITRDLIAGDATSSAAFSFDDLRIYNEAKTPEDVYAIYRFRPGQCALYGAR